MDIATAYSNTLRITSGTYCSKMAAIVQDGKMRH